MMRRAWIGLALAGLLNVTGSIPTTWAKDNGASVESAGPSSVLLGELPQEARQTHQLIHQGGPFPFEKDGTVFGNRERLLPSFPRGFYREYTVKTSGVSHRGARRIVCGGIVPSRPQKCYYTADHYASFRRIVP